MEDERKAGGAYLRVSGFVRKISEFERKLILDDGIEIKLDDIVDHKTSYSIEIARKNTKKTRKKCEFPA